MAETEKKYSGYGYHGGGRKKGSKNPNAGRKPKTEGEKRDRNVGIRVTESELLMLKEKAANAGLGLTDFIINLVKNA